MDAESQTQTQAPFRFDLITLFPEFFEATAALGVCGRALRRGLALQQLWNPRDFATDRHRSVDDRPYGGGPGMVMQIEPLRSCIAATRQAAAPDTPLVYLSPQGERLHQGRVLDLLGHPGLILLCGRYEGVDERLLASEVDLELSIGDYVLSGGELPAAVLMDALIRQLPGALGDAESAGQDSFSDGLLDCPHYSRPEKHELGPVPSVLMSGDHAAIARWRRQQALGRTWLKRPELLQGRELSPLDRRLLADFQREYAAYCSSGPSRSD